jgi:hypothetical protein
MIRAILALLQRALREECRQTTPWLVRAGLALFSALLILPAGTTGEAVSGAAGLALLRLVAWASLGFLLVFAAPSFATSITEEKEEEALPLLRLTDLTPLALLLGKSASRLLASLVLLLAPLPFLFALMPLGGVSLHQVTATYACLLAFAFFLNGAGTLASVILSRSSHAITAIWITAALATGPSALVLAKAAPAFSPGWTFLMNPFIRLGEALSVNFQGGTLTDGDAANLLAGLALFTAAWLCFDLFNHPGKVGDPDTATLPGKGEPEQPPARRPLLEGAPVYWKDREILFGGHTRLRHAIPLLGAIILLLTVVIEFAFRPAVDHWLALFFAALATGAVATIMETAGGVVRSFQTEIREKTLAALIMANITLGRIVREKTRALLFLLKLPLATAAAGLLGILLHPGLDGGQKSLVFNACLLWIAVLFLFAVLNVFFTTQNRWAPAIPAFGCLAGIQVLAVLAAMPTFASGLPLALIGMTIVNVVAGVFFQHLCRDRLRYLVTME